MNRLTSRIITVKEAAEKIIRRMAELMSMTYDGTSLEKLKHDLAEKQFILLLNDESGETEGFSTIQLFDSSFRGKPVKIVYSGDTVIREEYRGQTVLMHDWWKFTCSVQRKYSTMDVYWMLISKGWRTYKMIPLFFKEYFPRTGMAVPDDFREFMDSLGNHKFPGEYRNGLIIPKEADYLKNAENDVPERRKNDPDVNFFIKMNPDFGRGDELLCITRLAPDNLTETGRRILNDESL